MNDTSMKAAALGVLAALALVLPAWAGEQAPSQQGAAPAYGDIGGGDFHGKNALSGQRGQANLEADDDDGDDDDGDDDSDSDNDNDNDKS